MTERPGPIRLATHLRVAVQPRSSRPVSNAATNSRRSSPCSRNHRPSRCEASGRSNRVYWARAVSASCTASVTAGGITSSVPGTASTARPPYARNASSAGASRQLSGRRMIPLNRPFPFPKGSFHASAAYTAGAHSPSDTTRSP